MKYSWTGNNTLLRAVPHRHFEILKKNPHKIRNLLNQNEMHQWRNINRNARCVMSTCNTQLQLILLNSFVFLTSFCFAPWRRLFSNDRSQEERFKVQVYSKEKQPRFCAHRPHIPFVLSTLAETSGQTQAWTGRQRDLGGNLEKISKFYSLRTNVKLVLEQELKPQEMGEGMTGTESLCVQCSLEYHVQDSWLALTCVIVKIIFIYPVKKPQPINQPTFIVKQIWAVETQLLCSVKWIFSKSQTHKLNFTHHLPLLNFLTRGFGLWMLPHSQTMAQRLSRPSAAPVQHQCSCDPATTNRSFYFMGL